MGKKSERIASKKYKGVYYRLSTTAKHKGKPDRIYWIAYYDAGKKLVWQKIGAASAGIDEAYANGKRIEAVNLVQHGENPERRTRNTPTLADVYKSYIEKAEADGRHVVPEKSRWENHIKPRFGRYVLAQITEEALTKFKSEMPPNISAGTAKHIFSLIRRIINFAIRKKTFRGLNPIGAESDFEMPKVQNKNERFFSTEEAQLLLDRLAEHSQQLRDMSWLALHTGLRLTEIRKIKGKDLDKRAGVIWVDSKGGEREHVPATKEVFSVLKPYNLGPEKFIFPNREGNGMKDLSRTFERVVDDLKLNKGIKDRRQRVTFHTWRHTFASWLAQSGEVDIFKLMQRTRHKRMETVMRYVHLIPGHDHLSIIDKKLTHSKNAKEQETPTNPRGSTPDQE